MEKLNNSNELFEESLKYVPGGVHSPVRSFKGLKQTPVFFEKADGAYITDVEGRDYIDFCMSFGPLILGHRNRKVEDELKSAIERGWSYGACEPYSLQLAKLIIKRIPIIEQVRFVNSGTEAVMTALRLSRGVTGRSKIIKFNGCYHGHVDSMLIKAGSGLAEMSEASSKGIPESIANDTIVLELGDTEALKDVFTKHGNEISCIIVEPLPANNGLLVQTQEYLQFLRDITKEHGAHLIFDEVISGFRVGFSGMAGLTDIKPDLITFGKIIGGGLPVGALGATKEIMEHLAPKGPVYQAGTLSANPLAMIGGMATLEQLDQDFYTELNKNAEKIVALFNEWLKESKDFSNLHISHHSSLFWIHGGDENIHRACDIPDDLAVQFTELFDLWLKKGIYLAPNAYEVGFVSIAHNDEVIEDLRKRLWS